MATNSNKIDFNRDLKFSWPALILVGIWILLMRFLSFLPLLGFLTSIFFWPLTWLIKIAGAVWVGYAASKEKASLSNIAIAGACYGFLVGVIDVIATYLFHFVWPFAAQIITFSFNLFMVPVWTAATGAIVALVVGLIFSNKK